MATDPKPRAPAGADAGADAAEPAADGNAADATAGRPPDHADADTERALERARVEAAAGGDRSAFDALVQAHQRRVYLTVYRYLRNDADAADVTQRVFLRAYRGLGRFRGDARFATWLHRIAVNLSLNHLRDRRHHRPEPLADDSATEAPVGARRVIAGEQAAALRAAVEELPPKQRMVLELRIYDELPFKDVARLAACSENSAKVNFHHAVKRLRALLAEGARPTGSSEGGGGDDA